MEILFSDTDVADVTESFSVDAILIFESIFAFIFFVNKLCSDLFWHRIFFNHHSDVTEI